MAVSYGPYQGPLRAAIHALKFDHIRSLGRELGQVLAAAILRLEETAPRELLVVPVPLHRSKLRQRGFNQTQVLASSAVGALRKMAPDWQLTLAPLALLRSRRTESQAGLTPRQRRLNLRAAFRVPRPALVAARNVLLIDDILTTGATARSATQALLKAGAAQVWVATLARAQASRSYWQTEIQMDQDAELAILRSQAHPATDKEKTTHPF